MGDHVVDFALGKTRIYGGWMMKKQSRNLQDIKMRSEVIERSHLVEGGWTIHYEELPQHDFSQIGEDGKTEVFFRQIEKHLVEHIERYDVIVGCVAWLTNETILKALAKRAGVSLVIQKEDFLRPDRAIEKNGARKLRALYEKLPRTLMNSDFEGTFLRDMWFGDYHGPEIEPVRCIGNVNTDKSPAFPRSHHKFIVFCNREEDTNFIMPMAVWTGSYNFSKTAEYSFENAIILYDKKIVRAFFQEYIQIVSLSESLDWKTEWAVPDWYRWDRKHRTYTEDYDHTSKE
jgi:hypothetical protein